MERVDVKVGVPVAVPSVATGHLGAVHTRPVAVVLSVMLLDVPCAKVAVTVTEALLPWVIVALAGLTPRLYTNAAVTVNMNVVDLVLMSSALPLIVTV